MNINIQLFGGRGGSPGRGGGSSGRGGGGGMPTPNGKEGSLKGLQRDMQKSQQTILEQQRDAAKYGFQNGSELQNFINDQWSEIQEGNRWGNDVSIRKITGDMYVIDSSHAKAVSDFLKANNIYTSRYGQGFSVYPNRNADYSKKRKRKK